MQLGKSGISVATYLTDLPGRHVLQKKLHEVVRVARNQLGNDAVSDG